MNSARSLLYAALVTARVLAQPSGGEMAFTVSVEPAAHTYHVSFHCTGLTGEVQDLKMPGWMPGYYRMLDYARRVSNFRAADAAGHALPWEKVTRNTWRVATAGGSDIVVDYDVAATASFVAQNYLDDTRGFVAPPGLFLHLAGQLQHPVTVTIRIPAQWSRVSTGLDPAPGRLHTFSAPDFDVLYDCPILMGNQEWGQFEAGGVPHRVVLENVPPAVDREKMLGDLKRIVEAATGLIGDIPYRHYTFLLMGNGRGGIEHLNSAAISFDGKSLATPAGYLRWLSYVTHEYFHAFNVKRIRPLALGPFDYETENLTDMLWVSEGLSVYYEDLVLVRAGLLTPNRYLEIMQEAMTRFENASGHRYQSAAESSLHTWGTSGVGNDRNTTISYYDNGAMLGALLDLAIRHGSENRKSLDDVMRALYRKYYREKKRGFTDAEFRAECEAAAGGPLSEVFEYVSTSREMDYGKYFAYAGLAVQVASQEAPGALLSVNTQTEDDGLTILESHVPGLLPHDRILAADDAKITSPKALNDVVAAKKPGDPVKLRISRNQAAQDVGVVLGKNQKLTYTITPLPNPSPLQAAILKEWLRTAR